MRTMPGSVGVPANADPVTDAVRPARQRHAFHVTDAVPGAAAVTHTPRVTARAGTPRVRPMRDTIPLRPTEHATRATRGAAHTYVMRDGFVTDARSFTGAADDVPTTRVVVTDDGHTYRDTTPHTDTPRVSRVGTARAAAITVGPADMRNACDRARVTVNGTTRVVHVDGNGSIVRTVADADAVIPYVRPADMIRRRGATRRGVHANDTTRPDPTDAPSRVPNAVVDMFIRATGYAGAITPDMRRLARDAMAAQRQRDAYLDADD